MDIRTPTNLNKKQEALLRDFKELETNKLSSKLKKILKGQASRVSRWRYATTRNYLIII